MTNLFSAGRPGSLVLPASSRESMLRCLCRISANNSISLLRIASVSTASHGAKTVNGWNGQRPTGNSSSTMCARDSSNLTGGSFWNSIGARTVLHFSHQNCARSLNRKGRGSCVGKPCLLRIRIDARDSNCCSRRRVVDAPKGFSSSALRFAQRNGYSFQSAQSQPSICSSLAMSSANRL